MPNYKTCLLSIYILLFGLTSFAQTESVPKNIVTINTFGFYRLYIPFFEAEYERKINNKFAIKVGYTFISKHNKSIKKIILRC